MCLTESFSHFPAHRKIPSKTYTFFCNRVYSRQLYCLEIALRKVKHHFAEQSLKQNQICIIVQLLINVLHSRPWNRQIPMVLSFCSRWFSHCAFMGFRPHAGIARQFSLAPFQLPRVKYGDQTAQEWLTNPRNQTHVI